MLPLYAMEDKQIVMGGEGGDEGHPGALPPWASFCLCTASVSSQHPSRGKHFLKVLTALPGTFPPLPTQGIKTQILV